jgi:hypothetical protein
MVGRTANERIAILRNPVSAQSFVYAPTLLNLKSWRMSLEREYYS